MSKVYNLSIKAGETFTLGVTWNETTEELLTGASAQMDFREDYGQPVLASISSVDEEIVIVPADLGINVYMPAAKTLLISGDDVQEGVYDLKVVLSNGFIDYPIEGRYRCRPSATLEAE